MIDKITPRPDASIEEILKKDGVEELDPVVTSKNTYVAPFVNAEECQYLVIEDNFPNGRPALEKGGLIFTTRENEGLHLLKPAPHRACCLRLPARLQLNLRGDEESFFKEAC